MTAYDGLLPVATMLEKLQFQQLIEEHVTIQRLTTSMSGFRFVLGMILALYVGFSRLNHLQFLEREPMLTGILQVVKLPPQCTFWRFLASLHLVVAGQLLEVGRRMRQRVWENIQNPIQADLKNTATALAGVALPGAIDQDLAHDMCGDLKEMGTVAPGHGGLVYQPQVGFVQQVGGLEAARRSLPAHMTRGDLPQLVIGQLHQARFGLRLAIPEGAKKTRYLAITPALHWFPGSGPV